MQAIRTQAAINVTPLIDVLLVLLIVFMVIAPVRSRGLDAAVPQPATTHATPDDFSLVLQIAADGSYRLNSQAVPATDLETTIERAFNGSPHRVLFVKPDRDAAFQNVARTMDRIRGADGTISIALM